MNKDMMSPVPVCTSPMKTLGTVPRPDEIARSHTRLIEILKNKETFSKLLSCRGETAQELLDVLQELHRAPLEPDLATHVSNFRVQLSRESNLFPRCLSIEDITEKEEHPHSSGSFGDIYQARQNGKSVCLKVCRLYQYSDQLILYKAFYREAMEWAQLMHPNILPFYGIHRLCDVRSTLCLVTPWMNNGNIYEFLSERPHVDRTALIGDVAAGMEYLHKNGVVHGDLKSVNVLVTASERACLADFGLSYIADNHGLVGHALSSYDDPNRASFDAPELLNWSSGSNKKTQASDVYAFGMVCFEIMTGERPFGNMHMGSIGVYERIVQGGHPDRPLNGAYSERGLTDNLWALMVDCWSLLPEHRPTAVDIVQSLYLDNAGRQFWEHRVGFDLSSEMAGSVITKALSHLESLLV